MFYEMKNKTDSRGRRGFLRPKRCDFDAVAGHCARGQKAETEGPVSQPLCLHGGELRVRVNRQRDVSNPVTDGHIRHLRANVFNEACGFNTWNVGRLQWCDGPRAAWTRPCN